MSPEMGQTAKEYLEAESKRLVDQAREVTRAAEADGRTLSDDERMKVEGLISETNDLKKRISEIEENEKLIKAIDNATNVAMGEPTVAQPAKTLGEAFVKADAYKALKARGLTGSWTSGPIQFGEKLTDAGLAVGSIGGAGGSLPLNPQVSPLVTPVEEALKIADLFTQATATQNLIVYLEETTTTTLLGNQPYSGQSSAASTVAEAPTRFQCCLLYTSPSPRDS